MNQTLSAFGDIEARYTLLKSVAGNAAKLGMDYYTRRENLTVIHKENDLQDVVSVADKAVEDYIRCELSKAFPSDGFLGEEGGALDLEARYLWVIDPIDGTSCFVNGLHSWCVSIGLMVDGLPVLGAIADPNHGELFHACRGAGAFVNDTVIRVHAAQHVREGLTGVGTTYRRGKESFLPFLQGLLDEGGMFIRNGSAALMISYVAAGRLIGYYETNLKSWDCLAGLVVLQEAGGIASDFLRNNGLLDGNSLLVACPGVYEQLSDLVGPSLDTDC
ncbi:inositol monophosphatase family protein [Azomonas macrocytogenes]|uniref:Inositol-1-monophosphatase n=1 Tax=Azomonas macrocytogenes TaxID=69962 RepID=A0A839T784_AZOMA|nr:inositol monophosphatase [Azomonas macrocytogenes]MBB3104710.1 myo-inositol-1(or 4)-monophosphatase [Azomonas macrocytogenes]